MIDVDQAGDGIRQHAKDRGQQDQANHVSHGQSSEKCLVRLLWLLASPARAYSPRPSSASKSKTIPNPGRRPRDRSFRLDFYTTRPGSAAGVIMRQPLHANRCQIGFQQNFANVLPLRAGRPTWVSVIPSLSRTRPCPFPPFRPPIVLAAPPPTPPPDTRCHRTNGGREGARAEAGDESRPSVTWARKEAERRTRARTWRFQKGWPGKLVCPGRVHDKRELGELSLIASCVFRDPGRGTPRSGRCASGALFLAASCAFDTRASSCRGHPAKGEMNLGTAAKATCFGSPIVITARRARGRSGRVSRVLFPG